MNDIQTKVVSVVSSVLNVDARIVTPELSIGEIPEWDSAGNLAIIVKLESEFDVEIPLEDLMNLTSVQGLVEEIAKLTI